MRKLIKRLMSDQRGVTALEYALVAGVMVFGVTIGFMSLGFDLSSQFNSIASAL